MPKLSGKKTILITAGPTIEPIDPVRYLSNYSTGLMGYELAKAAKDRGHRVVLISGPTGRSAPQGVTRVPVTTALDMKKAVFKFFKKADCVVMAAAVSDFRPASVYKKKIKKPSKKGLFLKLTRNPDILKELGGIKNKRVLVGYALETERPVANAKKKLESKNLDIIVANKTGRASVPFGAGAKNVAIIDRSGRVKRLKGASKERIANTLLGIIEDKLPR